MDLKNYQVAKSRVQMTPGRMLKTIRELQEMSQNELAQKSNMTQSNISAMENDRQSIGRERALSLSKILHVHPAVIMFPDFDIEKVA